MDDISEDISETSIKNWTMLDEFESEQYERVIVPVKLDAGHTENAYIYQIKPTQ